MLYGEKKEEKIVPDYPESVKKVINDKNDGQNSLWLVPTKSEYFHFQNCKIFPF